MGACPSSSPLLFNHSVNVNCLKGSNIMDLKESKAAAALFRAVTGICDVKLDEQM